MALNRKLFICPWFGDMPPWMETYVDNILRMKDLGYDWLIDTNLPSFSQRCWDILKVKCPIQPGTGKIHDYRPALGHLYAAELEGYDFWGHTDFDCVYGRVNEWVTDEFLESLDIHSNHHNYICGPWTLYRNIHSTRTLFLEEPYWRAHLEETPVSGWAETDFTRLVDREAEIGKLRREYTFWQGNNVAVTEYMHWEGDRLMDGNTEIFMCHFNRSKVYPVGLR